MTEEPATRGTDPARAARRSPGLLWYAFARGVVEGGCRLWFRVEVRGREHVPTSGPYVLAPVHRSNVDTLLAGCVTRRRIRFMGKDSLWRYRWSGALFSSLGGFPVHRGTPDREALRVAEAAIRAGEPVVLFPEGTRRSGPVVEPLFEGAAFVAARCGVPVVPVGIGGSEWAMPKGTRWIRPVKVAIVVGPPITPPALTPPNRANGRPTGSTRVPRRVVSELTERLHTELQDLFDQALTAAGRG